ncbi:GRIP and coiled-coil domain-containing protein 1 [Scyliorhinus canicula]|uniref:GRIP and coiled-coil domain-containing protein 1 n=1 Tax=Scyliorhinus canicula TaxID=7830 RepID=UPI0018F55F43|nr:GRIP and coiled-coil domain-containing protein 1 [Scyliorhinus canicula]XP_038667559.1 GRIP and coiled-coil domain-containing protein 1 [Scyliorhinus canicula]XP_038667560.1 GRIP and coiled-coil domain-containing protein 1 [Scyliorhinus canicula]XP_038667562.1 GRIP and coiled-coil domain-containing protein 1 [Scyliorhinus canicula]
MEKFGVNFGGGPGKKELLDTIEAQKKQLFQYQTRLRDVVRAYKSLIKEKEALEASLKVLSVSQDVDNSLQNVGPGSTASDLGDDQSSVHSEDSAGTMNSMDTAASLTNSTKGELNDEDKSSVERLAGGTSSPKSEEANGSESGISVGSGEQQNHSDTDKMIQLKSQLATLTNALATVTQEKSRMEASYLTDKKKMRQELEDLTQRFDEESTRYEAEMNKVQEQLAEAKARIITQQHERSREQSDHASMLHELQKLLQEERALRQDVELQLEDTREMLTSKSHAADRVDNCESQMKHLNREVDEMKCALRLAGEEKRRPDPRVQELEEKMTETKTHYQAQLQLEIKKAVQVQEQLRHFSQMEEERVANLEGRVSELSELLGTYDKSKQKDKMTIHKLKDRIIQLDMENKTLAIAASNRTPADLPVDESNLDVNILRDKMEKLKRLLVLAIQKSQQPIDVEKLCEVDMTGTPETSDGEKASVFYYQQELKQLKEEFERYKMRAQVVLKNKNAKDGSTSKELESLREQLAELKEKYITLRLACDEMETKHTCDIEAKNLDIAQLQAAHKKEIEKIEGQCHERVIKLEEEMHKHRDRTLAVLAEKDRETETLRSGSSGLPSHRNCVENKFWSDGEGPQNEDNLQEDFCHDILKQTVNFSGPNEPTFLHYAEQLARKELEVTTLRKQKHQMEAVVHELEDSLLMEKERHKEDVEVLQDEIQKHLRDKKREGANLEYVKNVTYRFLTMPDALGRQQTLTAILTVLHFSPQEKQNVMKQQASSWWGSGKR